MRLAQDASQNQCAIKIYEKQGIKSVVNLQKEIEILRYLDHEQVVKLLDVYQTEQTVRVGMRLMCR